MDQHLTAVQLVTRALAEGALGYHQLLARTGLTMLNAKQAVLRLRNAGLVVTEEVNELRVHRLLTEEERELVAAAQRCELQYAWRGIQHQEAA